MDSKRRADHKIIKKWASSVGGTARAVELIREALECSFSKAEKIATGRYKSLPSPAEQKILAALLEVHRDIAFPFRKD